MNRTSSRGSATPSSFLTRFAHGGLILAVTVAALAVSVPLIGQNRERTDQPQQNLATAVESAAETREKLHQYQWTETTQLSVNGNEKAHTQYLCMYESDGRIKRVPLGPVPGPPHSAGKIGQSLFHLSSGEGGNKEKVPTNRLERLRNLLDEYVPTDPRRMQDASKAGNVFMNGSSGDAEELVLKDYAQPGDKVTLTYDRNAQTIVSVNVNTYIDDPKDAVTLTVRMAKLPDGTSYPQQSVLHSTHEKLRMTTTCSSYQLR